MTHPGGPLIVLDATTFDELRRIDVGGSISSIAAWGDRVLVTRWDTGELVEVYPTSGEVGRRMVLPDADGVMLQIAVLDD
jgi:hypothetical protein